MIGNKLLVSPVSVAGQQTYGGDPFPLVLACGTPDVTLDDAVAWISEHADELCQKASQHGAILFRGFPLHTAEDFDRFLSAFGLDNFPYEDSLSNAVRVESHAARIHGQRGSAIGEDCAAPRDGADAAVSQ